MVSIPDLANVGQNKKSPLYPDVREKLKKLLHLEFDLYEFAKKRLLSQARFLGLEY